MASFTEAFLLLAREEGAKILNALYFYRNFDTCLCVPYGSKNKTSVSIKDTRNNFLKMSIEIFISSTFTRVYRTKMVGKSIYSLLTLSLLKGKDR